VCKTVPAIAEFDAKEQARIQAGLQTIENHYTANRDCLSSYISIKFSRMCSSGISMPEITF